MSVAAPRDDGRKAYIVFSMGTGRDHLAWALTPHAARAKVWKGYGTPRRATAVEVAVMTEEGS